jgi:hypothetical protein
MLDKLCYYSKSKNSPAGKGTHEAVKDPSSYTELNNINNWRRILSNFYSDEPFFYKEKKYISVEHAFQSYKIALANPDKAFYFTLDSNHPIGRSNGAIAQKNRKIAILNDSQLKHWDSIKDDLMTDITYQRILINDL